MPDDDGIHEQSSTVKEIIVRVSEPSRKVEDQVSSSFKIFEQCVKLVKALAWPLLSVILLVTFYGPIKRVVQVLPDKLSEANKFTVGSLSMEIQVQARQTGNMEMARALQTLSPGAVEKLILIGGASHRLIGNGINESEFFLPPQSEVKVVQELVDQGLCQWAIDPKRFDQTLKGLPLKLVGESRKFVRTRPLSAEEKDQLYAQNYRLTELGSSAFRSVVNAVEQQLAKSKPNSP